MDNKTLAQIKEEGEFRTEDLNRWLTEYAEWLNEDSLCERNIPWSKNSDVPVHSVIYHSFCGWAKSNVYEHWYTLLRGVGHDELRSKIKQAWENDGEWADEVKKSIVVINDRRAKEGTYLEVMDSESSNRSSDDSDGDNMDDTPNKYGKLEEVGIVDGDMGVDYPKLRGTALKFSKDVDEVVGTEEDINRDDIRTAYNRWMLDRLGDDWSKFITEKLGPSELTDVILYMWKNNDGFKENIENKWKYDEEELEGNGESRNDWAGEITNYADEVGEVDESEDIRETGERQSEEGSSGADSDPDPIPVTGSDVINDDCVDVVERMEGQIGAIITDPPYGMDYDSRGDEHDVIAGDDDLGKALELTEDVLKKARMNLRPGSPIIVFAGKTNLPGVIRIVDKWFDFQDINIWDKEWVGTSQIGGTPVKWRPRHEYAVLGVYKDARVENENRHDGNVWRYQRKSGDNMDHPTEKPVEMLRYIIESLTEEGDVVFDPFAGSGSTLVAADQTDRGYFGVELDEDFYQHIEQRLKQDTITAWG